MTRNERHLPPGPNRREDQMTEKDQRQLREHLRKKVARSGEGGESEWEGPSQAEGERDEEPARKVGHTAGQAEGDRQTIEEELEKEKKPH
jgi:hypothetical protein